MKSHVELDIHGRQEDLAELFADPQNNPQWMDDIDHIEPLHGEPGDTGSVYRMVPKRGHMVFVATVVGRALPTRLQLLLEGQGVSMRATDTFLRLSERETKLISDEEFSFEGFFARITGWFGRWEIARAHRRHLEAFKRFAERQLQA